jgi:RNA polymerase sigma-70 factor (sigma-E family)
MRKLRHRDSEFAVFFEAHSERLRRLAVFLTGNPSLAADLAQEALVRTYRHWGRIREQDPGPYARRVVVNLVRSQHRRSLLARRHEQTPMPLRVAQSEGVEDWLVISEALKRLPPTRRAAIVLRYYEDMTDAQIAETLDRPIGTVKSDIHRGLAKLREYLEADERESA